MKKDWTEDIKKRIDEHSMAEPEGLWQSLEKQIGDVKPMAVAPAKRRASVVWLRRCGVAAAVAVLGVLGVTLMQHSADINLENVIPDEVMAKQPAHEGDGSAADASVAANSASQAEAKARMAMMLVRSARAIADDGADIAQASATAAPGKQQNTENSETMASDNDAQNKTDEVRSNATEKGEKKYASDYGSATDYNIASLRKGKRDNHRYGLSLNVSGLTATGRSGDGLMFGIVEDNMAYKEPHDARHTMPLHHKLPINVGVKVKFNITNCLFAESGLTYSYLRSTGDTYSERTEQRLHYLGIPVDLGYVLWQNNRLKVYAYAGGECQKLVSGTLANTYNVDSPVSENISVSEKRLQWSVNAGAGVEVGVVPMLSIYAEPGVKHFFDNGSTIDNIYKDKPTNFNLQVGLRLNF